MTPQNALITNHRCFINGQQWEVRIYEECVYVTMQDDKGEIALDIPNVIMDIIDDMRGFETVEEDEDDPTKDEDGFDLDDYELNDNAFDDDELEGILYD